MSKRTIILKANMTAEAAATLLTHCLSLGPILLEATARQAIGMRAAIQHIPEEAQASIQEDPLFKATQDPEFKKHITEFAKLLEAHVGKGVEPVVPELRGKGGDA